jgi:hypothetical protein
MNESPEEKPETTGRAFDEFPAGQGVPQRRPLHETRVAGALRILSGAALVFAFASAGAVLVLDAAHWLQPDLPWRVKSALPLIGIGVSYALLQPTLQRTRTELLLSLAVSVAFILWGTEQFIPMPRIASQVDDVVVFLFVMDLGIVIRGRLTRDG